MEDGQSVLETLIEGFRPKEEWSWGYWRVDMGLLELTDIHIDVIQSKLDEAYPDYVWYVQLRDEDKTRPVTEFLVEWRPKKLKI